MKNSLVPLKPDQSEDMFSSLPPMDSFWIKKDEIAAQLLGLMAHEGKSRASLATELGWHKSRVTSVLSGKGNPTIKTIWEFCHKLNYDFDLVFRKPEEGRPDQPWDRVEVPVETANYHDVGEDCSFIAQTPEQVVQDYYSGAARSIYITLSLNKNPPAETASLSGGFSIDFSLINAVMPVVTVGAQRVDDLVVVQED